jgi:hypothetical protein
MGANKASPPSIKYMLLAAVSSDIPSEICSSHFGIHTRYFNTCWSSTNNDNSQQFSPFSDVFTNGCFLCFLIVFRISMASLSVFIELHFFSRFPCQNNWFQHQ